MIKLNEISKIFKSGENDFFALKNISVTIPENKITVISGPSGSGKSTLLSIIGLLQAPSSGDVIINGEQVLFNNSVFLRDYISKNISYVFQEFNLVDDFSVVENISLVCDDLNIIDDILSTIGLIDKKKTPTKLLSGGEKQRLAIGRAIAKSGNIIFLDEPTGNLDEENAIMVFNLLKNFSKSKTIVIVTHDTKLAYNYADYMILLNSGSIVSQFSLTDSNFMLDFTNNNIDAFLPAFDVIKNLISDSEKEIVVKNYNDESCVISSSTVLSVLTKIYEKHKGTVIEIIIKNRNENSTQIKHSFMRSGKPTILPFKIISKYAAILFKSKLWRNIFSILLLVLNIIMIFVYTNIAAYDYETATKNAGVCNNAFYAQPYIIETNSVTSETRAYFNGSHLHGTLKKFELDPLPLLIVNSDISGLQLSLVIIDKPVQFKNSIIEPPELDNVLVSSFVNSIPLKKNTIDIFCSLDGEFDFNYTLNVQDYFESNYDKNDMSAFLIDPGCQNSMKDKFTNNYAVAFISASTFSKIKNVANFHLNASNFFLHDAPIKKYASKSIRTKYKIFDNNNLIGGRAPINENEIVISNAFLKEFGALGGCNSISECLNKKFHYRDLANISNRDVYQSILNFHDITDTVTIVGVTDDKSSNVYTNPAFMESLFTLKNMYLSGFFIDISSQYNNMKEILDGNIYFDLYYLKPIFSMKDLVNSDLMILILVALIIVLVSTTTFLCITFVSNVKGKYKEIAILKSFGTSKRRISIIFFLLNFFIVGVSIIIGLAFGVLSQYLMNLVFMSPKLFNINFQLIVLVPISFVVVIFISLIVTLFSTFLALHKVNKIDVALALKMF